MRRPTSEKNISDPQNINILFRLCRKSCHADVESLEQQAILLKKVEIFSPKLRFSCFSGETFGQFCHAVLDFREHEGLPPD